MSYVVESTPRLTTKSLDAKRRERVSQEAFVNQSWRGQRQFRRWSACLVAGKLRE
jgi:hypothetical protein